MADDKYFFKDSESAYGEGVLLDEYHGTYSLIAANRKDNTTYLQWCFPQRRDGSREPMKKSLPWKVKLGNKDQAIEMLRYFASLLEGSEEAPF